MTATGELWGAGIARATTSGVGADGDETLPARGANGNSIFCLGKSLKAVEIQSPSHRPRFHDTPLQSPQVLIMNAYTTPADDRKSAHDENIYGIYPFSMTINGNLNDNFSEIGKKMWGAIQFPLPRCSLINSAAWQHTDLTKKRAPQNMAPEIPLEEIRHYQ